MTDRHPMDDPTKGDEDDAAATYLHQERRRRRAASVIDDRKAPQKMTHDEAQQDVGPVAPGYEQSIAEMTAPLPSTDTSRENYDPSADQVTRMRRRYSCQPGRILGKLFLPDTHLSTLRDEDGNVGHVHADETRLSLMRKFSGWLIVLMVGPPVRDQFTGKMMEPHPLLKPGVRVLVGRSTPEWLQLESGGEKIYVGKSTFAAIDLIDLGPEAEEDSSRDEPPPEAKP